MIQSRPTAAAEVSSISSNASSTTRLNVKPDPPARGATSAAAAADSLGGSGTGGGRRGELGKDIRTVPSDSGPKVAGLN